MEAFFSAMLLCYKLDETTIVGPRLSLFSTPVAFFCENFENMQWIFSIFRRFGIVEIESYDRESGIVERPADDFFLPKLDGPARPVGRSRTLITTPSTNP